VARFLVGLLIGLLIGAGVLGGVWAWRSTQDDGSAAEQDTAEAARLALRRYCTLESGSPCEASLVGRLDDGVWRVRLSLGDGGSACYLVRTEFYRPHGERELPDGVERERSEC
jgi:hypothetical protein